MVNTKWTLFAAGVASAAAVASRNCRDLTVPVSISARNGVFDLKAPENNIEVTDFFINLAQVGHNYTAELLKGVRPPPDSWTSQAIS
jgi:hypothetical protein